MIVKWNAMRLLQNNFFRFRRLTLAASVSKKRHSTCSVNDSVTCANVTSAQSDMAETKLLDVSPEVNYNTYMSKYLDVSDATIELIPEFLQR